MQYALAGVYCILDDAQVQGDSAPCTRGIATRRYARARDKVDVVVDFLWRNIVFWAKRSPSLPKNK